MKVARVLWSPERAARLRGTFTGDEEAIKEMVEAGRAAMFETEAGGLAIVRKRITPSKRELVLMCAAGAGLTRLEPVLVDMVNAWGLDSVRIEAMSDGVERLAKRLGFETTHRVMIKHYGR